MGPFELSFLSWLMDKWMMNKCEILTKRPGHTVLSIHFPTHGIPDILLLI